MPALKSLHFETLVQAARPVKKVIQHQYGVLGAALRSVAREVEQSSCPQDCLEASLRHLERRLANAARLARVGVAVGEPGLDLQFVRRWREQQPDGFQRQPQADLREIVEDLEGQSAGEA